MEMFQKQLNVFKSIPLIHNQCDCLQKISSIYIETGQYNSALEVLFEQERLFRKINHWPGVVDSLSYQADVYMKFSPPESGPGVKSD